MKLFMLVTAMRKAKRGATWASIGRREKKSFKDSLSSVSSPLDVGFQWLRQRLTKCENYENRVE
jgi:hypothetical protein